MTKNPAIPAILEYNRGNEMKCSGGVGTPRSAAEHRVRMSDMGTIRIPLHSRKHPNLYALIDEEDAELVNQYRWFLNASHCVERTIYYAVAHGPRRNGPRDFFAMHRIIVGAPPTVEVDHINGDGLDNRRSNLRQCTSSQNKWNFTKRDGTSSRFRGVTWNRVTRKWRAQLQVKGKQITIGDFQDEEAAAAAYDGMARKHFGEFGTYNFPRGGERSALKKGGAE